MEKTICTKKQYKDRFITDRVWEIDDEDGHFSGHDIVAYLGLNNLPDQEDACITQWNGKERREDCFWFKTSDIIEAIKEKVNECGWCKISFSCDGRTRHLWQSKAWAEKMPEFEWEFDYDYYYAKATKR